MCNETARAAPRPCAGWHAAVAGSTQVMMPREPHASFRFTSSALILQKYQLHTGYAPRLRERVPICDSEFRSYQTPLYLTFLGLTYAPGSWEHRTDQLSNVNSQARANRVARILCALAVARKAKTRYTGFKTHQGGDAVTRGLQDAQYEPASSIGWPALSLH